MSGLCLKPGNAPRSRWRRGAGVRTPVALVYLHGFTASPDEAGQLPDQMAEALGANLYVHRWPAHGIAGSMAMAGLRAGHLEKSAEHALQVGLQLGSRMILVGSSMGATLAFKLAAAHPDAVAAVIAWSPGVAAANPSQLEALCASQEPIADQREHTPAVHARWSSEVHPDGYRALRDLFEGVAADPPWPRVRCPVFMGYFRDEAAGVEDQVASVSAMLDMFAALGTPPEQKRAMPFAAGAHSIGSPFKSQTAPEVARASTGFAAEQLRLLPENRIGQE